MKRHSLIVAALVVALISTVQYRLIWASFVSLGTGGLLWAGTSLRFGDVWNPALLEFWTAAAVWFVAVLRLIFGIVASLRRRGETAAARVPPPEPRFRVASVRIILLFVFVALTSPFLTPVGPDVQGNLVTARLLPPLSGGIVREFCGEEGAARVASGGLGGAFKTANDYLLHRTVLFDGNPPAGSPPGAPHGGVPTREFRTVFLFGTDDNARDVYSRVVAGTRVSLGIGLTSALGALLIGCAVGFAAGMSRGVLDAALMRLTDLFLAVPGLFLVIGIIAFVGQSLLTIIIVLAFSGWMGIARIVRGEVVSLREREFILASKLLGVSPRKILTRHFLPNLRPVIVTAAVLQFANAVLGEASLGFLGLGIQPPTATWGNMMGEATGYLASAWWVGVFPGVLLALLLVAAHAAGEAPASGAAPEMQGAGQ